MLEVALGVFLFTAIVLGLALVVLAARARLVPSGSVTLNVNDRREVEVPVGGRLLGSLSDAGIHVPSACGGGGSCGLCRVRVLDGGGPISPIERSLITRGEANEGERLACQVPVKRDMRVRVPDEVFGVREWECTVRSNRNVATLIKELDLALPEGETIDFRAGAFVEIEAPPFEFSYRDIDVEPEYRDVWDAMDLWQYEVRSEETVTRAYSMANHPLENDRVMLDVRVALPPLRPAGSAPPGIVSSWIFGRKPGDKVKIAGPYGHFFATKTDREMVYIGGGAGMAPMRSHIFDQLLRVKTSRRISFWYGARNRRETFYVEDFDRLAAEHENFTWHIALSEPTPEDEWEGLTGFIHDVVLHEYLESHPAPEDCEYYLCGPGVMMKAVTNMLDSLGVERDSIFFDDFGN